MRKTHTLIQVAAALMKDPDGKHWGYDTAKRSGVRPGALYPIFSRMIEQGWLSDGWEDPAEISGRPPRRYYQLTGLGRDDLRALLVDASRDPRFASIDLAGTPNDSPFTHQK